MSRQTHRALAADVRACRPRLGATRVVVVDGPAGSGKTTFAEHLRIHLADACVLHMDDLYAGWHGLDEDLTRRLRDDVLEPLARGCSGRYQRYDWHTERFTQWHDVPPAPVLLLEGVGSAQQAVDPWASLRVWVEAPPDVRLERGIDRDGAALRDRWLDWLDHEARHFAHDDTRTRADLLVDGTAVDDGTSFVVLEDRRARACS